MGWSEKEISYPSPTYQGGAEEYCATIVTLHQDNYLGGEFNSDLFTLDQDKQLVRAAAASNTLVTNEDGCYLGETGEEYCSIRLMLGVSTDSDFIDYFAEFTVKFYNEC